MNYTKLRARVDAGFLKQKFLNEELAKAKQSRTNAEHEVTTSVQALAVAQEVAQLTQKQLEQQLSDIVTPAIQAIFGKPYVFKIDYVQKRKKTEAEIYLEDENGNRFDPMTANGGGIVDITALALRMACWKIGNPQSAPVLIFDEAMKFISEDFNEDARIFLIEIVKQLNIQVIMVTHVKSFIKMADNVIRL